LCRRSRSRPSGLKLLHEDALDAGTRLAFWLETSQCVNASVVSCARRLAAFGPPAAAWTSITGNDDCLNRDGVTNEYTALAVTTPLRCPNIAIRCRVI
jgi:hypothetical protein